MSKILAPYKGQQTVDKTAIYCPYVPLTITGAHYPPQQSKGLDLEFRDMPGAYWRGAITLVFSASVGGQKSLLTEIGLWCVEMWGAPGFERPALWYQDRELIFVTDPRLFVEFKLHWHGHTVPY